MSDTNKVLLGFKNLYIGTWEDDGNGNVTMGSPYHQVGARGFSPSESTDTVTWPADDIDYYTQISEGAIEGDLTVAKFDDAFKVQFLGYKYLTDGGLAQVKNAVKPNVYIAFEVSGDKQGRRVIFYNGTLGSITREYSTKEQGSEPVEESLNTSFVGDPNTGARMAVYHPGDAGYDDLFTSPAAPVLAGESS